MCFGLLGFQEAPVVVVATLRELGDDVTDVVVPSLDLDRRGLLEDDDLSPALPRLRILRRSACAVLAATRARFASIRAEGGGAGGGAVARDTSIGCKTSNVVAVIVISCVICGGCDIVFFEVPGADS
jgi:hypothetical protein